MRSRTILIVAVAGSGLLLALAADPLMSRVEEPTYIVETSAGTIEVRRYPELIVATTDVEGNRRPAIQAGFRALADYIFGGNERSTKIEMTAPVLQTPQAGVEEPLRRDAWAVRFVMPHAFTRDSLPAPKNDGVRLETQPPATYAVIRFSGFTPESKLRRRTDELRMFMAAKKLPAKSEPIYAFYNPPWTLPFLRRNEIMIATN